MKNIPPQWNTILDMAKWQSLQNTLANATKLAIITVDYKGDPVSQHSNCHPFCAAVRNNPELLKKCKKCDSRGGIEAVQINKPYIYLCHYGIIDIAIPLIVNNHYFGAVMAGQVRLMESETSYPLEQIVTATNIQNDKNLFDLYHSFPVLTAQELEAGSLMLFELCNYIIGEALKHHTEIESQVLIPESTKDSSSELLVASYSPKITVLRPFFEFLSQNANTYITSQEAAKLCNLSISYFSRLFSKETGSNYAFYMSHLKINQAKHLLETTELPIVQISDLLGFGDPSYFIRIFKKHERLTPALYRNFYKKR